MFLLTIFSNWGWSWPPWRHKHNMREKEVESSLHELINNMKRSEDVHEAAARLRELRARMGERISEL